jgi:hypothetical protein
MWALIRDETGKSDKRKHTRIIIKKNRNLISEPTHVEELFNAYFTEIQKYYSLILPLEYLNILTISKNFQPQYFLHPQMMK